MISDMSRENEANGNQLENEAGKTPTNNTMGTQGVAQKQKGW